ncbi:helix-turn-helix transcriptional regulator [Kitasatospora sp. NPDC086009]|uniref:helix-turn-helix transcriptional regulator n=1 Tax=unclassified Kitasatospora TaxID=2633591 RepID=UPI0037CAC88C
MNDRQNGPRAELGAFLRATRERTPPGDVGLRAGARRRTPGLRRQEVAELAAVSVDWYIRLEQGRAGTPGSAVLEGIADALRLTPAEREYVHLTARGEVPPRRHVATAPAASLRAILDGMPLLPAYVIDHRLDVLAWNSAARALFGDGFGTGTAANTACLTFLDPENRRTQPSWEQFARETVGALRSASARHRGDPRLHAVVAQLLDGSPEFALWWEDRTVRERSHGSKRMRHPVGGELALCYDQLAATDGSDQRLMVLTPADGATERALRLLIAGYSQGAVGTSAQVLKAARTA